MHDCSLVLSTGMRTLRRAALAFSRGTHDMNVKLERNSLRRKASVVATGLISKFAMDGEVAGQCRLGGEEFRLHRKCVGIYIELLARIERKRNVLAGRKRDVCSGEIARGR